MCCNPVSCSCCCVGAPLVSAGPIARVDSAGKPACEDCGARLNRCKGKLHNSGVGKICTHCFNIKLGLIAAPNPISTRAAATLQRSHKRRADSDPGEPTCATAPALLFASI